MKPDLHCYATITVSLLLYLDELITVQTGSTKLQMIFFCDNLCALFSNMQLVRCFILSRNVIHERNRFNCHSVSVDMDVTA